MGLGPLARGGGPGLAGQQRLRALLGVCPLLQAERSTARCGGRREPAQAAEPRACRGTAGRSPHRYGGAEVFWLEERQGSNGESPPARESQGPPATPVTRGSPAQPPPRLSRPPPAQDAPALAQPCSRLPVPGSRASCRWRPRRRPSGREQGLPSPPAPATRPGGLAAGRRGAGSAGTRPCPQRESRSPGQSRSPESTGEGCSGQEGPGVQTRWAPAAPLTSIACISSRHSRRSAGAAGLGAAPHPPRGWNPSAGRRARPSPQPPPPRPRWPG